MQFTTNLILRPCNERVAIQIRISCISLHGVVVFILRLEFATQQITNNLGDVFHDLKYFHVFL